MDKKILTALFFLIGVGGCANAAYKTHSEDSVYYAASQPTSDQPTYEFKPVCVIAAGRQKTERGRTRKFVGGDSCLYMAVEGSYLLRHADTINKNPKRQSELLEGLLLISDTNCSNFLHRALAVTTNWETGSSIVGGMTSVTSTALTKTKPDLSQLINLSGVIVGDVTTEMRKGFLLEGTFAALEKATNTLRAEIRAEIKGKRARLSDQRSAPLVHRVPFGSHFPMASTRRMIWANYPVQDILRDIRRYDDACSLRAASQKLLSIATDAELKARVH